MAAVCLLVADLAARFSRVHVLSVCVWRAGRISVLVLLALPVSVCARVCVCRVACFVCEVARVAGQVTDNGGEFIVEQPQSSLMFDCVPGGCCSIGFGRG